MAGIIILFVFVVCVITSLFGEYVPVKTEDGWYFPGRGCGGSSEIKYLNKMPKDTSQLRCTFVTETKDLSK
jgi:hypothetical protein